MDKFGGMFRCSGGDVDWTKAIGTCLWSLALVLFLISLPGCSPTINLSENNFNQGAAPAGTQAVPVGAEVVTTTTAPAAPCGNTITFTTTTSQDSKADGSLSTDQGMAGKIGTAISDRVTDLRKTDSENPVTTTTTTTTNPVEQIVEEELGTVDEVDSVDDIPEDNPIVEED